MATLKKYDLSGQQVGEVQVQDTLAEAQASGQTIKEYIVALRANLRQWSANTKDRSEVSHSTKKPHRQKGLGRARQGSLAAPQFKGGGVVFGPKPKFNQHVRINRRERRAATRALIGEKIRDGKMLVLTPAEMAEPKTKTVASFIKSAGLSGRVLFLLEGNYVEVALADEKKSVSVRSSDHQNFRQSVTNLPKAETALVCNTNGYDLLKANHLVVTEPALAELEKWLAEG
ncbi:MAG: 50S ribosomal protein L4 [Waddliaceae bacterium]|nr:50S ribosomal protein L4 [Waddliaceae bacterium]